MNKTFRVNYRHHVLVVAVTRYGSEYDAVVQSSTRDENGFFRGMRGFRTVNGHFVLAEDVKLANMISHRLKRMKVRPKY